jgi:hypothetical protein
VDVPADHGQGGVPQDPLESHDVHPGGEGPGGEGVAELVGVDVDPRLLAQPVEVDLEPARGQWLVATSPSARRVERKR